jgi:HEAT repeat protein
MKNQAGYLSKLLANAAVIATLTLLGSARPALAGRGSNSTEIKRAIASGSVDAISAELERAERLVCSVCVTMVRPLVDNADPRLRRVAVWWLARHGLRTDLFVEAANRLGQPDSRLAQYGADVLGSLRNQRAIAPLGAALNNPVFDPEARVAMAEALARIGEPSAVPALVQATRAQEAPVRAAAIAALRDLRGTPDPAPALALLADPSEDVRAQAIYTVGATRSAALGSARAHDIVAKLGELCEYDGSAVVRRKAVWALGEIHAPASLARRPLLLAANYDKDASVRTLAQAALTKLGAK